MDVDRLVDYLENSFLKDLLKKESVTDISYNGQDIFYVDNNLVLDLGGTHSAVMGTINFRTGDIYYDKAGAKVHGVDPQVMVDEINALIED